MLGVEKTCEVTESITLPAQKVFCCQDFFQEKVIFTVSFLPQVRSVLIHRNGFISMKFLQIFTDFFFFFFSNFTVLTKLRLTLDTRKDDFLLSLWNR